MRYLAETLAATDEAPPRPLAMAGEERKQEWGEADGERMRGTIPPAPLFIKGWGRGSAAPSRPIRLLEVTASGAVNRPPRSIEGAWELTRTSATSHIPRAYHSLCIMHAANVAQGAGAVGRVERRFPSKGSKWEAALRSRRDTHAAPLLSTEKRRQDAHVMRMHGPHVARSTQVVGKRSGRNSGCGKIRLDCPRTILGLAQQRVALMCGPGPGAPVGVQK